MLFLSRKIVGCFTAQARRPGEPDGAPGEGSCGRGGACRRPGGDAHDLVLEGVDVRHNCHRSPARPEDDEPLFALQQTALSGVEEHGSVGVCYLAGGKRAPGVAGAGIGVSHVHSPNVRSVRRGKAGREEPWRWWCR